MTIFAKPHIYQFSTQNPDVVMISGFFVSLHGGSNEFLFWFILGWMRRAGMVRRISFWKTAGNGPISAANGPGGPTTQPNV